MVGRSILLPILHKTDSNLLNTSELHAGVDPHLKKLDLIMAR